jgi:hypothetical protein
MKRRGARSSVKRGGKLTATGERRNQARANNVPSNVPSSMQARVAKFGIGQVVRPDLNSKRVFALATC